MCKRLPQDREMPGKPPPQPRTESERTTELRSFRHTKWRERFRYEQVYREQLALFGRNGEATVKVGQGPCTCGKHKGLIVTLGKRKTTKVCPITLWLFRVRQLLREADGKTLRAWAKAHPLSSYIKEA